MLDWLHGVKTHCKITFSGWHQWLPASGSFFVLAVITLNGFEIDSLGSRLASLVTPSSFLSNEAKLPADVLAIPSNHQKNGEGTALSHAKDSLDLPPNQKLDSLHSEAPPLLAGPSPTLLFSVPSRLPEKLGGLGIDDRKKLFIGLLLPTVTIALDEVKQERQQLLTIIAELGGLSPGLSFAEDKPGWQQQLGDDKSKFILGLTRKYRTENAEELVAMVNVLPPSLIIAQGAIESAWGSSRFAIEVNNLFGMYSNVDSSQSDSQDGGKTPKIMEYETILDSVRSYILNINRLSAYKELRRIRCQTLDPMLIAEGLAKYSERKEYYIADVKHIIARNNLQSFDTIILAAA